MILVRDVTQFLYVTTFFICYDGISNKASYFHFMIGTQKNSLLQYCWNISSGPHYSQGTIHLVKIVNFINRLIHRILTPASFTRNRELLVSGVRAFIHDDLSPASLTRNRELLV